MEWENDIRYEYWDGKLVVIAGGSWIFKRLNTPLTHASTPAPPTRAYCRPWL